MQPVVSLVTALRSGVLPLKDYIGEIQATYQQREPEIEAFLPEPQRFNRLYEEAGELERLYPQPIKTLTICFTLSTPQAGTNRILSSLLRSF